jgi:ribonuclease P protein component
MSKRRLQLSRFDFTAMSNDKGAKRATTPHFSIVLSNSGVGSAVVVSKKVAKSSVQRHLIKRRVREILAPWCSDSFGIIAYARAGSAALPYSEMVSELTPLLRRIVS